MNTSLELDPQDRPHLAFYNLDIGILEYAHKDESGWHRLFVDQSFSVGRYGSLELDGAGLPHISYYDGTNLDLKYAHMLPEELIVSGGIEDGVYVLTWAPYDGAAEFWVYGASNLPHFTPGSSPGFDHRLAQLPPGTTSWSTTAGVGDPANNWTYLVIAVNGGATELSRSNRVGEFEFGADIP